MSTEEVILERIKQDNERRQDKQKTVRNYLIQQLLEAYGEDPNEVWQFTLTAGDDEIIVKKRGDE